jgi:hypothetical protein
MASTYVNDLRLEEMATGENSGTWGTKTNTNLELICEALSYSATGEAIANNSTHTITIADGAADEARCFYLKCTGGGQACTVTLAPNTVSKVWLIENQTSYTLTFSQGSGANVAIAASQVKMIATDGAGSGAAVYDLLTDLSTAGDLFVAGTVQPAGDTAAGDDAAIGYTSAEGLILTGQGSTSDVTVKNDADATVFTVPTGTDDILFPDSAKAMWGAGSDLQVYHDGSNSYVADAGTGTLNLLGNQVLIKNAANDETMLRCVENSDVELYFDNSEKLATVTGGVNITGDLTASGTVEPAGDTAAGDDAAIGYTAAEGLILTGQGSTSDITVKNDADGTVFTVPTGTDDILFPDDAKAMWGAGSDMTLHWDGTDGHLTVAGTLNIDGSGETMATFVDNGAVTLYYDNSAKLATVTGGVNVTGELEADSLDIDGVAQIDGAVTVGVDDTGYDVKFFGATSGRYLLWDESDDQLEFVDNVKAAFGTGADLQIYHDGSNSYISDAGTGTLNLTGNQVLIKNVANDATMLRCVQGSDVELYFNGSEKLRTVTGGVDIVGAITKDSGSFRIEHPLDSKKATHKLVHSFIEGPKADLIYRGRVPLVAGSATVDIDSVSTMTDGTFVALCRDVQCFTTNETGWTQVKGSVSGNTLTITAQDSDCTDTISWMVIGERQDKHMKETDWTDADGHVIVEPVIEEEEPPFD